MEIGGQAQAAEGCGCPKPLGAHPKLSREVSQENAGGQSGWGGVGLSGMQNYGVKTCFRCDLFMCPEGLEGADAILVRSVHAEK